MPTIREDSRHSYFLQPMLFYRFRIASNQTMHYFAAVKQNGA